MTNNFVINVSHLRPEELAVEFEIRGIAPNETGSMERLRSALRNEDSGAAERPKNSHNLQENAGFAYLLQILSECKNNVRKLLLAPNFDDEKDLRSRVCYHRVDRFQMHKEKKCGHL